MKYIEKITKDINFIKNVLSDAKKDIKEGDKDFDMDPKSWTISFLSCADKELNKIVKFISKNKTEKDDLKDVLLDLAARPVEVTVEDLSNILSMHEHPDDAASDLLHRYPNGIRIIP